LRYLLGIDDTDSRFGRCTTHLGYLIVRELIRIDGCGIPTYLRLVRLNPNIPFKTRGNASVCIEFDVDSPRARDEAFEVAETLLEAQADVSNGANAALVMASKDSDDLAFFRNLYQRALSGVVSYTRAIRAVSEMGIRHRLLGNGMGVVGATASLGFMADIDDHTYELIAYRKPENCGKPRAVDPLSVKAMEIATFPHTFNSYDHESGRVLIAPKGPDPVLLGIRGESPQVVLQAFGMVRVDEEPLGHVIYATNQCTDAHLSLKLSMPLTAFSAGWLEGQVLSTRSVQGGHLAVELGVDGSAAVNCMVYEPSGDLRRVARRLKPGDHVRLSGGVRKASSKNPPVMNVEKMQVLSVARDAAKAIPRCAVCGSSMKSEGLGKGHQCRKCGLKRPETAAAAAETLKIASPRIHSGVYLPSPRAQRHLTKQLIRYGRERTKVDSLVEDWLEPTATSHGGLHPSPLPVMTSRNA
jgi:tRNA(Ile2)-agmatinylcytidine synthase